MLPDRAGAGAERLVVADLDLRRVVEERRNFDPIGHYSRADVFDVQVDRRRPEAVRFTDRVLGRLGATPCQVYRAHTAGPTEGPWRAHDARQAAGPVKETFIRSCLGAADATPRRGGRGPR